MRLDVGMRGQGSEWGSRVETGLLVSHSAWSSLFPLPCLPLCSGAEWILLHLHPGQRLLLGINKSWGFLSSQLSRGGGGGTWKEGWDELEGVPTRMRLRGSLACPLWTPCRSLDP